MNTEKLIYIQDFRRSKEIPTPGGFFAPDPSPTKNELRGIEILGGLTQDGFDCVFKAISLDLYRKMDTNRELRNSVERYIHNLDKRDLAEFRRSFGMYVFHFKVFLLNLRWGLRRFFCGR